MNTKELVAALKEIEPHVEGNIVQDNYLEVRLQDPNDPDISYPVNNVKGRFFVLADGIPRFTVVLS